MAEIFRYQPQATCHEPKSNRRRFAAPPISRRVMRTLLAFPHQSRVSLLEQSVALCGLHDALRIASRTHIAGASIERRGPHLFVGYTVRADDRHSRKFAMHVRNDSTELATCTAW